MNVTLFVLLAVLAVLSGGAAAAQSRPVNPLETEVDLKALKANNTKLALVPRRSESGAQALQVEFQPAEWPNVTFASEAPWDWRNTGGLALEVTNPGRDSVTFFVRVDDDPKADGIVHCRTGSATIEAGKTATFFCPFGRDPMAYGMRGLPAAQPGLRAMQVGGSGPFDISHIVAFQVFLSRPAAPVTLLLDNVRTVPPVGLEKIVDRFGQYAGADWPGKLKAEAELAKRRQAEEAELKARPALPDRDGFGGWTKGLKQKATGFFRAEKVNDRWWLVTPEGNLFLSMGMDCVSTWGDTFLTGREYMFSWLPEEGDPLARHYGRAGSVHSGPVKEGRTYSFFRANLERKYGRDYEQPWFDLALDRLRAWGFNTVANWSDARLYGNGRVPYVATSGVGGDHARISSGSDYWGRMHDPFDPKFAADAESSLRETAAKVKGDPWCIGWFVDNELSWGGFGDDGGRYGLAYGALGAEPTSPAKQAFLKQLREKYGTAEKLNAAWGTSVAGWAGLDSPFKPSGPLNDAMKADMGAYVKAFARQYFRVVRDTLKKLDPDHLYMGCRFAWHTPEAVEAAAELCDVLSFNIYRPRVDAKETAPLAALDRPCIIGEFHFGALDRGMFHTGLVSVPDQKARAAMYVDYLHSVLDHPAFVGCHWFQFVDEPLTGRTYDGENYNIGFLTVTDTPYPEMVEAAKAVHGEAYTRRYGKPRP